MSNGKSFSERIRGPVFPVLTIFKETGDIDETGISNYVEYLISQGVKTLMCTVGTSRYDVLTTEEILRINNLVVESAAGRATTIVTTPSYGPLSQAINFAKQAEISGADAILAVYPDRYYGDEFIVEFFESIAASCNIGVMIHEMPIRAGRVMEAPSWQYSKDVLGRLLKTDNIVGIKEESADPELIHVFNTDYADKCALIGGRGGMVAHLQAARLGQRAYLVGIGNFQPRIEIDFYNAIVSKDYDTAENLISTYETPFFDVVVQFGWHPALKEAMHILGLCTPYERSPMPRIPQAEREQLGLLMSRLDYANYV